MGHPIERLEQRLDLNLERRAPARSTTPLLDQIRTAVLAASGRMVRRNPIASGIASNQRYINCVGQNLSRDAKKSPSERIPELRISVLDLSHVSIEVSTQRRRRHLRYDL
ncbi:MAG: hypothetical protein ACE5HN_03720 [Nitrospiria bacterium]